MTRANPLPNEQADIRNNQKQDRRQRPREIHLVTDWQQYLYDIVVELRLVLGQRPFGGAGLPLAGEVETRPVAGTFEPVFLHTHSAPLVRTDRGKSQNLLFGLPV